MSKKFGPTQILIYPTRNNTISGKSSLRKHTLYGPLLANQNATAESSGFLLPEGTLLLGIDPGTAVTGWAIVEFTLRGAKFIAAGAIRTSTQDEFSVRLVKLSEQLNKVLDQYHPSASAIEEPFFGENAQSALTLGQARGALLLTIAQKGIPVFSYSPKEVKRSVVGTGSATKQQVAFMVKRLLQVSEAITLSNDATDALAVAYCHSLRCRLDPSAKRV
ncbi:MAG: crossover junction endodeoxyribonuclease RuvC [bacterium]|nr:crossover junction endodeoxyribonuclease RuvC [bacterium]